MNSSIQWPHTITFMCDTSPQLIKQGTLENCTPSHLCNFGKFFCHNLMQGGWTAVWAGQEPQEQQGCHWCLVVLWFCYTSYLIFWESQAYTWPLPICSLFKKRENRPYTWPLPIRSLFRKRENHPYTWPLPISSLFRKRENHPTPVASCYPYEKAKLFPHPTRPCKRTIRTIDSTSDQWF